MSKPASLEDKLRCYLELYWLRPENGLLCAFKSRGFDDLPLHSPSLDICCGDGLFMFLHLGGRCGADFDYFVSTRADEFEHNRFVDIFDSFGAAYDVPVITRPTDTIDQGTDWKQALLDKASRLNLYGSLTPHDINCTPLPFAEQHFETIYSNAIYWTQHVESLLTDIRRMLLPGGQAILEVMTPYFLETLDEMEPYLSPQALHILDRGRRQTMPGGRTVDEWRLVMQSAGLVIEECRCVYPAKVLLDIWNIGLRPISHLLIQMTDSLPSERRSEIKREWVDIFFELFKPLLSIPSDYSLERAPYLLFVVRRKSK